MSLLLEPRWCEVPTLVRGARCNRAHHAKGMCLMHYRRVRRNGDTRLRHAPRLPCPVPGCTDLVKAKGRCLKHYLRQRARTVT